MNESKSCENAPQGKRHSLKNFFHSIFKPGNISELTIKNIRLTDIPTQATKVFLRAKIGRSKHCTSHINIINNAAEWKDEFKIEWKVPGKAHSKKPYLLRFSLRLEDSDGRGFTRYGFAVLDLTTIQTINDWHFSSALQGCNYGTSFSCLVSIKSTKLKTLRMAADDSEIEKNKPFPMKMTSNKPLITSKPVFPNPWTRRSTTANACEHHSLIDDFAEEELPFKINENKLNVLSQQVDEIISKVLFEQSEQQLIS